MHRFISQTQRIRFATALAILLATLPAAAQARDASAGTPKRIAFPDKVFGDSGETSWPKRLKISIPGISDPAARIRRISIVGTNAADFTIHQRGNCIGAHLGAGCGVTVTFTPTGLGTRTATLTVTDNSGATAAQVAMTGRGIKPSLKWQPREISFGKVRPGATSKPEPVSITNPNAAPLSISKIYVNSTDFLVTGTQACMGKRAPHSSCRFYVTAKPSSAAAKSKKDSIDAKLQIQDNAAGNPHLVKLSALLSGAPVPPPPPPPPGSLTHAILVTNTPCNNVTSYPIGANGNAVPTFPQPLLCNPTGIAVAANQTIYVTNTGIDGNPSYSVAIYAAGSTGQVAPTSVISGPATGLDVPRAIALDVSDNIYVANDGSKNGDPDSVTIYTSGSSGNQMPTATISGPNTGLSSPAGIAVDSAGSKIYVANSGNNTVTVYPRGTPGGNIAPIATISGFHTELFDPIAIALDSGGNLYVVNSGEFAGGGTGGTVLGADTVTVYLAGSKGNASPSRVIGGVNSALSDPSGIALSLDGKIYVTNGNDTVTVYAAGTGSQVSGTPIRTITGAATLLNNPFAIAVDQNANIYVANAVAMDRAQAGGSDTVTVYPAGSNNNQAPMAMIDGASNGTLDQPAGIAVDNAASIYVTNEIEFFGSTAESVEIYQAGSGTVGAGAVIGGISTNIGPSGIALDSGLNHGLTSTSSIIGQNIYLVSGKPSEVQIYSSFDSGLSPLGILSGPATQMSESAGVALDANGNIYVTNDASDANGDRVTMYLAQSTGNMTPVAVIVGSNTGLAFPVGIAVDTSGIIYVANAATDAITEYAKNSSGNVSPINTISGPSTGLNTPFGIALDSSGLIYVANAGGYEGNNVSVTVYAANATGNAIPVTTIAGSLTQLARPHGVAVIP